MALKILFALFFFLFGVFEHHALLGIAPHWMPLEGIDENNQHIGVIAERLPDH